MKTYSVYLPPDDANKPQTASDISYAKFLVDGKCIAAVFLPPLWLIWNRLWWGFAVYLAFSAIISLLAFTDYREAIVFLSMIPGLFLLLEGHELIRQYWKIKAGVLLVLCMDAMLRKQNCAISKPMKIKPMNEAAILFANQNPLQLKRSLHPSLPSACLPQRIEDHENCDNRLWLRQFAFRC